MEPKEFQVLNSLFFSTVGATSLPLINQQKQGVYLSLNMRWYSRFKSGLPFNHLRKPSFLLSFEVKKKKLSSSRKKGLLNFLLCAFFPFDFASNFPSKAWVGCSVFFMWNKIIFPVLKIKSCYAFLDFLLPGFFSFLIFLSPLLSL